MMDFRTVLRAICAGVVVMVAGATPCRAVDYQPFDWVPAPPGAGILMGYYQFATHSELTNTITGPVKNSHLDSHIGIARYLYYNEAFGHPFVLDLIVPFGALTDGRIGGNPAGTASGIADPIVSVGAWLIVRGDVRWRCEARRRPDRIQDGRASDPVQLFAVHRAHLAGIAVGEP